MKRKFTICALFYFVFEGKFQVPAPRGSYIQKGDLRKGFLRYDFGGLLFGGAYTWRGLFSEFYGYLKVVMKPIKWNTTAFITHVTSIYAILQQKRAFTWENSSTVTSYEKVSIKEGHLEKQEAGIRNRNGNRNRNRKGNRNRNRNEKRNLYKNRDNIYLNLS